jgi:hypothetical protein
MKPILALALLALTSCSTTPPVDQGVARIDTYLAQLQAGQIDKTQFDSFVAAELVLAESGAYR